MGLRLLPTEGRRWESGSLDLRPRSATRPALDDAPCGLRSQALATLAVVGQEALDAAPEGRLVVELEQVGELVDHDVVEQGRLEQSESPVQADAALGRAASPAAAHVLDGDRRQRDADERGEVRDSRVQDVGGVSAVPDLEVLAAVRLRGANQLEAAVAQAQRTVAAGGVERDRRAGDRAIVEDREDVERELTVTGGRVALGQPRVSRRAVRGSARRR